MADKIKLKYKKKKHKIYVLNMMYKYRALFIYTNFKILALFYLLNVYSLYKTETTLKFICSFKLSLHIFISPLRIYISFSYINPHFHFSLYLYIHKDTLMFICI